MGVLAAAALVSNIGALRAGEQFLRAETDSNLAALAAIDGARESIDPEFVFQPGQPGTPFPQATAADTYFTAVDDWGSPVDDPEGAVSGTEEARQAADALLAAALGLEAIPSAETQPTDAPGCSEVTADPASGIAAVELPPAGAVITSDAGLGGLRLRRWSQTDHPVDLGPAPAGSVELAIPSDGFAEPWVAELTGPGPIQVCPISGG